MMLDQSSALDGQGMKLAIVAARFNAPVCEELLRAAVDELINLGVAEDDITVVRVPGALEIPLTLQALGESLEPDAMIALGAVIRGETYHFELVSNESGSGITAVQLDLGIPIANGVLTTDTDEQAEVRAREKGVDCARAAIEMAQLLDAIRGAE